MKMLPVTADKTRRLMKFVFGAVLSVSGVLLIALVAERSWAEQRELVLADPDSIPGNSRLAALGRSKGEQVYRQHCAACHGLGAVGDPAIGVPDLSDREFLYGEGRVVEIEDIVRHGIRAGDRRGRNLAYMPAYATAKPYDSEPIPPLNPVETRDVVQALLKRGGRSADSAAAARGDAIYLGKGGCYDCHGGDAKGDLAIGAPNLIDPIWLYGRGTAGSIAASIEQGRKGYSPAFKNRLSPVETRAVAIYVALLPERRAGR